MKKNLLKLSTLFVLMTFVLSIANAQVNTQNRYSPNVTSVKPIDLTNGQTDLTPSPAFYKPNAKGEVTIGTGTVASIYPINAFYGYTYSQSIFLQSEINQGGDITRIQYYFNGTSLSVSNDWTIYIGHTTKTEFTSTTDWVPLASMTQVYSHVFTSPTGPGWIVFDLDVPFTYNNTDNLVIAIDENAAGYDGSSDDFYSSNVTGFRSLCYYNDYTNPAPSAPPTAGYRDQLIPNIKIKLGYPQANDCGIDAIIAPPTSMGPGSIAPQVTVKNYGTAAQTNIPVSYKIGNGAPVSTTVASLAAGATTSVTFPTWNATVGTYAFTFYTGLSTDTDHSNDTMRVTTNVALQNNYYAYNAYGNPPALGPIKIDWSTGNITQFGTAVADFMSGADFIVTPTNKTWWTCEYSAAANSTIYTCDTLTGVFTAVGSGCGRSLEGLAWNPQDNILYGTSYDGSANSNLVTIDRTTGVATVVGSGYTASINIDLACNAAGDLFAINLDDNLYSVNKTTGEGTLIGPLGVSINYAQGLTCNRSTGQLIGALYTTSGVLGTIDAGTGTFTQLYAPGCEIDAIAYPHVYIPVGINEVSKSDAVQVYPNPANNVISIIAGYDQTIKTIKVINIAGQTIQEMSVDNYIAQINVSNFDAGVYFVQVSTDKGFFTKKITVTK